ncbi:DUF2924 domain-containing protein [Pacificispira sp.]|uniref:DUF2924 domain-containing protein n=1 Tax=Pacificispira sp. TaxID=2888761 RepID=UPI003B52B8A2
MVRQRKNRARAAKTLDDDLAALPELPLDDLKRRWAERYGSPPPPKIGRALLTRAVAYRLQEQTFGGLSPAVRKRLARMADDLRQGRNPSKASPKIKPGTRLIREWQGVTHEVIVLEKGVQYRGKTWASLSAVAREITGTRWSGPLFFGLKRRSDGRS